MALGIELIELETFLTVASLESFSLAAEHLHVTQPSVTGRVQRLESGLGTQLLIRTTRKVELTPDGARLLEDASGALEGLRKTVQRFRDRQRQARQRVVVAATPMLAALTLPPIIRDYSQRYTDVQVVLRDLGYRETLDAVDDGSADLAVLSLEGTDKRFRVQSLAQDDVVLVAPPNHPLAGRATASLAQIAKHPLMVIKQYEPMRERIAAELRKRGIELKESAAVSNLNTLLGMLDAGMGATLLTRSMALRSQQTGHSIVQIEGLQLIREFSVLRSRKTELGTAPESFIRFLRKAMSERTAQGVSAVPAPSPAAGTADAAPGRKRLARS